MEKFLFMNGTGEVKEVQSKQELLQLIIGTPDKARVRVWIYHSNEWINYATLCSRYPSFKQVRVELPATTGGPVIPAVEKSPRHSRLKRWIFYGAGAIAIFFIYNFTKVHWEKTTPLTITAVRPANVPIMNIDSLFADIEATRGQRIDRNTRYNLRLRNSWPEKILLQATSDRAISNGDTRYSHIQVTLDNATGYPIDKAIARITIWKNNRVAEADTVQFRDIPYGQQRSRSWPGEWRGDSIAVQFESITAKAFNFCYDAAKTNNSGNYNDRWFCRDGN